MTVDEMRHELQSRLKKSRFAHSVGVANTAVKLAKKFGVASGLISLLQRGKIWRTIGGKIRTEKLPPPDKISDEVREQIRRLYVSGSRKFGSCGLAKRFGCNPDTILRIVHEK